jgi:hypothetical protein
MFFFYYIRTQHFSAQYVSMTMKKIAFLLLLSLSFAACNNKENAPDVSNIPVDLVVNRFDADFFSIDTIALDKGLTILQQKYPDFLSFFLENIVGATDESDTRNYYRFYKPIYDSSQIIYKDFSDIEKQLEQALKYVKYYYPDYKAPSVIMPIIGRMDSRNDLARMQNGDLTPNFIGPDMIGISLQFYLGKDFSLYNTEYFIDNIAPLYRSRRFSKEYIIADVMKLIADDIYNDRSKTKPLIEQMIEKGKQWWLMDKFLPGVPDSIITGYTEQQLNWVTENEGLIWSYILRNEKDLFTLNPATIQTYIGEAPFTNVFSQEESPGNIGPWIGWQIIKKFVENNSGIKPGEVMQTPAKKILDEAKYKPK